MYTHILKPCSGVGSVEMLWSRALLTVIAYFSFGNFLGIGREVKVYVMNCSLCNLLYEKNIVSNKTIRCVQNWVCSDVWFWGLQYHFRRIIKTV